VNWFGLNLYWGKGNDLESIFLISPVADLSDLVSFFRIQSAVNSSFSGCRSGGL
jgi:hypothetical protein